MTFFSAHCTALEFPKLKFMSWSRDGNGRAKITISNGGVVFALLVQVVDVPSADKETQCPREPRRGSGVFPPVAMAGGPPPSAKGCLPSPSAVFFCFKDLLPLLAS